MSAGFGLLLPPAGGGQAVSSAAPAALRGPEGAEGVGPSAPGAGGAPAFTSLLLALLGADDGEAMGRSAHRAGDEGRAPTPRSPASATAAPAAEAPSDGASAHPAPAHPIDAHPTDVRPADAPPAQPPPAQAPPAEARPAEAGAATRATTHPAAAGAAPRAPDAGVPGPTAPVADRRLREADERPTRAGWAALADEAGRGVHAAAEPPASSSAEAAFQPALAMAGDVAASAPPPVPADVRVADRSLSRLHPDLREKVERVVVRMQKELGLSVTLVEGYRTPQRQEHLFAQGRTAPGPVVTWTRESLHSRGLAADLKVAGPWSQPEAYAHLQRIAAQEGLATLGMKDPGHVELKGGGSGPWSPPGAVAASETPVEAQVAPRFAGATQRAGGVAQVAAVARPARVARPADVPSAGAAPAPATQAGGGSAADAARPAPGGAGPDTAAPAPLPAPGPLPAPHEAMAGQAPRVADLSGGSVAGGASAPAGSPSLETLGGVERALEVREAFAAHPSQRVTLRMDGGDGPVQRVRVDLADRTLRSTLDVADARLASRLQADGASILRTLESRGYQAPELTVSGVAAARGASGEATGDLLASLARGEGLPQALRALAAEGPGAGGRGSQDPSGRQPADRGPGQDGFQNHSRRENRREGR